MTYVYVSVLKLQVSLRIIIIPMSSYTTYQNYGVQVNKLFSPENFWNWNWEKPTIIHLKGMRLKKCLKAFEGATIL